MSTTEAPARSVETAEAVPGLFKVLLADLRRIVHGRRAVGHEAQPARRIARLFAPFLVVGLDRRVFLVADVRVAGRNTVVGGALENVQPVRLFGYDRRHLRPRRPGADDANALTGEIDALARIHRAVLDLAFESLFARDVRLLGFGELADRHDQELRTQGFTPAGFDVPAGVILVVVSRLEAGAEADVPVQIELFRDVTDVVENFALLGIALGPAPLLLELLRETV